MIAYIDVATCTFVLLYHRDRLAESAPSPSGGEILHETGFRTMSGNTVRLDLKDFACGGPFDNPLVLSLEGGEAFLECKLVHEMAEQIVELQLGAAIFMEGGLFVDPYYTIELRDRLVGCVERLVAIGGFYVGFSIILGDDENEDEYRDQFSQCVVDGAFSLARFVHCKQVMPRALLVGPQQLTRYGRETFLTCPAWRISTPLDDIVCVFTDNVIPSGKLRREKGVSYFREAFAHLEAALPPE